MQVDKTAACFYEIRLSRQQIDGGIIFAAHSKIGSRFKLLLFERSPEGRWELAVQVQPREFLSCLHPQIEGET